MIQLGELLHSPLYRAETPDLDYSRLLPKTARYVPREDIAIGMFDTQRAPARNVKPQTSHALSKAQLEQAAANRKPGNRLLRPHSIATRAIEAMRQRGGWVTTRELIEMTNRHMPEHCHAASRLNIYDALAPYKKRGVIESRQIAEGQQALEWRVKP